MPAENQGPKKMRVLAYNTHLFGKGMPLSWFIRPFRRLFGKDPTEYYDPLRAEKIANYIRNMAQGTICPIIME